MTNIQFMLNRACYVLFSDASQDRIIPVSQICCHRFPALDLAALVKSGVARLAQG